MDVVLEELEALAQPIQWAETAELETLTAVILEAQELMVF